MDYNPPGFSVHGIIQARILEWVAISFSKGSSRPRDWTGVSCSGKWFLYHRATWEAPIGSICSVQFSRSVVFDSLQLHGLQHARLPCPSPTPRAYSNSCPLSWWCHPTTSSSFVSTIILSKFKFYPFFFVVAVHSLSCVWLFVTPLTVATRLPWPLPSLGACSNSHPLSWWCHPTISSSVIPFSSCLQSFPASGFF